MSGKSTVILGGGFGGVAAARHLRKVLPGEHTVTLIDRQRRTYLCGSMPWLVVGERDAERISRSLGALRQRGIAYVQAEVQRIDLAGQRLITNVNSVPYDYLVVATGAEYQWDAVPGASQVHSFYNLETARRLRDAVKRFRGGRVVIAVSRTPYKCPPAPFEAAMLLESYFKANGVRKKVDLNVVTPEPAPLGITGPERSGQFKRYMAGRGITIHTEETLKGIDPRGREASLQSGTTIPFDLMVTIPVHRTSDIVQEAGLTNEAGWIPVDPLTLGTRYDGVYAIGDVNTVLMANGMPLPKAGVFAAAEGELVAKNIAADVLGGEQERFTGEGYCFIEHGAGKGALIRGSFMAEGRPRVELTSPSVRWHRRKERFEADWRRWKI